VPISSSARKKELFVLVFFLYYIFILLCYATLGCLLVSFLAHFTVLSDTVPVGQCLSIGLCLSDDQILQD